MGISVADNFDHKSKKPLDARTSYTTLAQMKAVTDANMNEGCLAYCAETDKYYKFLSTNTVDETTGKWREFTSGGGDDANAYHTTDTAETTLEDGDYFPFYDTSATDKRRTLWSNIKSVLKTYFDTLYSTTKTRGTPTSAGTTLSLVNTGDMYNWNTDSVIYCTCSTSASTTAKVATVSRGTFTLVAGAKVCVKFTYANTAEAPTLNVSSKGAKNIKYIGTDGIVETPSIWWGAGDVVTFIYDGTQFLMQPTYAMPSMPVLGTINRSDIYSTTEKVVGCWIDGRPIYQKSFTGSLLPTTAVGTEVVTNINMGSGTTVYQVLKAEGFVENGSGTTQIMPTSSFTNDRVLRFGASTNQNPSYPTGTLSITNSWFTEAKTYWATVWYTKSTDAANSYNYANENDYSTSEKIIGTWTNGATLYQKTYTLSFSVTSTSTWQSFNVASISGIWIKEFSGYIDRNDDLVVPICCDVDDGARYSVRTNSSNSTIKFTAYTTGSTANASGTLYLTIKYTKS